MNEYPQVVKDIHNEFNIAGERLLKESLEIIEKAEKVDLNKAKRLNDVGFINNPLLKKADRIDGEIQTPLSLSNMVIKAKKSFPNNKFILGSDVTLICKKYKLKHGDIEQYKGFVPEKNLTEIECFLSIPTVQKRFIIKSINFPYRSSQGDGIDRVKKYLVDKGNVLMGFSEGSIERFLEREIGGETRNGMTDLSAEFIEKSPFSICAPQKDMEKTSFIDKVLPLGLMFTYNAPIDPIVLYPFEMGYIIVTAWGDEASDPLVLNENNN